MFDLILMILVAASFALPTGGAQFVWFLFGVIIIAGGLTYLPAVALGPIVEHFALWPAR
jgi:K+-transporting ATPase ATPase A chain